MFYETVKAAWLVGKVRIGLPAVGGGDRVTIESEGLLALKTAFLSNDERRKLADLSKSAAMAFKARGEAIQRLKTIPLLHRVGDVVASITTQCPVPEVHKGMSKADVFATHTEAAIQETEQARCAEQQAQEFQDFGDVELAGALLEWATAKRFSSLATQRHIDDQGYQEWLNEPDDVEPEGPNHGR